MIIYLGDCCLYDFDLKNMFKARYMAKNILTSQKYKEHNKHNLKHKDDVTTKS